MRKAILGSVLLAMSIACTGCSNGSEGGNASGGAGGSGATGGGGGPNEAASFDADTALPASSASAIAMALGAQLGLAVSSVIEAIGEAPAAAELGLTPKGGSPMTIPIPGLCPGSGTGGTGGTGGTAILSFDGPPINVGEQVTLTFTDCVGSVFSGSAIKGTLVLTIEEVSGGFPSEATATVNLTVGTDTDTTIKGSFKATATLIGTLVDLCLGDQRSTDILTITRGTETIEFACFKIRQEISLVTGAADGAFEPVGVVRRNGTQVYTLNSYTQQPPSIGFVGGTATSGQADMSSGDGSRAVGGVAGFCAALGISPPGNNSFIANEFAGEACVMVTGQDENGAPIDYETTWSKLLNADFTPGGAFCGPTEAVPGPETCNPGSDIFPIADTFIQGDGSEGENSDTNFGMSTSLIIKSVWNLYFTRKVYIRFDIQSAPILQEAPATPNKALLILTLDFHPGLGPQPVNVFGITTPPDWDRQLVPRPDWDPDVLTETEIDQREAITWNNAPRNNRNSWEALMQFDTNREEVPLLIGGYDFDLGGDDVQDDPGTKYALDITEYMKGRQMDGATGMTILMAVHNPDGVNEDGSVFFSKEVGDEQECDRPFLRFE